MAKKQKKATPKRVPTKHQLSRWQRQTRIRRIVIIAAAVFLAGILSWVGYEYYEDYKDRYGALREVLFEVNGVPFTMEYYVEMCGAYLNIYLGGDTEDVDPLMVSYLADMVADEIINTELRKQGAEDLGIEVTLAEIDARFQESGLPDSEAYRDIIRAILLQEKLEEYFGSGLNATMEQARVQVVLVESEEVADEVIAEIEAGGNFTALAEEFSCNSSIEGDLGWLPRELMPNTSIADAAFNITPGEISQPIYDESAIKNVGTTGGYWLVKVVDKGERELAEEARQELMYRHLNDWLEERKENSTIENRLDEEKKSWAVDRVLQDLQER